MWELGDVVVVDLKGKLDPRTEERTQQLLLERAAGARNMVLDLSAVGYVSSAGLRVLLTAAQRVREAGGRLSLCAVPSYIKQVLDLAGFSSMFPIYDTRDEAVAQARLPR
jgi:anti-anti-sigma factor